MRTRPGINALAVTAIVATALISGCGGGSSGGSTSDARAMSDSSSGGDSAQRGAVAGPAAPEKEASGGGSGSGGIRNSAAVVPITRDVVYRGEITVRVKDVGAAVSRAEAFASGVDGVVFAEQTTTDPGRKGATRATMTLKVPPTQFRPVLGQLADLGKQLSRAQTAEDVTGQMVDIESRLRSQRRSVARLQTLMSQATTVGAIVQVEGELSQREADLEALEAQQKKLGELVDLATINVSFVSPEVKSPVPPTEDDLGFLSGLRDGWDALAAVAVVALTVAGALLPFLITLALVGVPVWLVLRSRRHPATPAPAGSDG
jgi:hypothetical protein